MIILLSQIISSDRCVCLKTKENRFINKLERTIKIVICDKKCKYRKIFFQWKL